MRYTTGGIGIDKVSFGLTQISIYGNDKFTEWTKDGVLIKKVVKPGDDQMTIILGPGKKIKPNVANPASNKWATARLDDMLRSLPKFGLTDPVGITMVGKELHIVMPPASKRAKLLRGHNKATLAARVSPADTTAPELPLNNTLDKVMHDVLADGSISRNGVIMPKELIPADAYEQLTGGKMAAESPYDEVKRLIARLNAIRAEVGEDKLGAYPTNGLFKAVFTLT